MSYKDLYDYCQSIDGHVRRNLIRDKVLSVTGKNKISVVKTALDVSVCRGFYLSIRDNPEQQLVIQFGTDVIVLARGQNRCWDRFIYVKELMHAFDAGDQLSNSPESFEIMLQELSGNYGMPVEWSPQFKSELSCFWMALGVLCPETRRLEFQQSLNEGRIDEYGIALQLKIPEKYVSKLFGKGYSTFLRDIS